MLSLSPLTSCSSVVGVLVYQPSRQCSNPGGLIHSQLLQGETLKLLTTSQSLFTCLLQSDISFKGLFKYLMINFGPLLDSPLVNMCDHLE